MHRMVRCGNSPVSPSQISGAPVAGSRLESSSHVAAACFRRPPGEGSHTASQSGGLHRGWETMSQVQTAELLPPPPAGGWGKAEIEFEDRAILCVDCGQEFNWTAGEQL